MINIIFGPDGVVGDGGCKWDLRCYVHNILDKYTFLFALFQSLQ